MDSRSNLCSFGHHCSLDKNVCAMKLEWTEGCVVSGLDIDGESVNYMEPDEQRARFYKCLDWYKHRAVNDDDYLDFLIWLTEKYGDFRYIDHCEQCGDSIYTTTLEI